MFLCSHGRRQLRLPSPRLMGEWLLSVFPLVCCLTLAHHRVLWWNFLAQHVSVCRGGTRWRFSSSAPRGNFKVTGGGQVSRETTLPVTYTQLVTSNHYGNLAGSQVLPNNGVCAVSVLTPLFISRLNFTVTRMPINEKRLSDMKY